MDAYRQVENRRRFLARAMALAVGAPVAASTGRAATTALANALAKGTLGSTAFNAALGRVTSLRNSLF